MVGRFWGSRENLPSPLGTFNPLVSVMLFDPSPNPPLYLESKATWCKVGASEFHKEVIENFARLLGSRLRTHQETVQLTDQLLLSLTHLHAHIHSETIQLVQYTERSSLLYHEWSCALSGSEPYDWRDPPPSQRYLRLPDSCSWP